MFDAYLALFAALSKGDPVVAIKATGRRRGFDNYRTQLNGEFRGHEARAALGEEGSGA